MRALCWHGVGDVRVDNVPDPKIEEATDCIVKVTSSAICGSDLHLLDGFMPTMQAGDVLGHEFMGEVMEVGASVKNLQVGDRVIVPFTISCGECFFCKKGLWSNCDVGNRNKAMAELAMGHSPAGMFGYSHMMGGYAGGQAQYVRVPYADVGPLKITGSSLTDEQVLFLSDIFPTGWMGAENAEIEEGDTVAIWGCGPVGQFAIKSAWMQGAGRVIAIDRVPERLALAASDGKTEVLDFMEEDDEHGGGGIYQALQEMTKGRGPDRCIDAVGTEAHTHGTVDAVVDNIKKKLMLGTDRPHVLRQAIRCCRKGGTISVPGVYVGMLDKIPFGAAMNKGLTFKMGQTHMHRYMKPLLEKIEQGEIDPSFIITHRGTLDDAPNFYKTFRDKEDGCIKCVLKLH